MENLSGQVIKSYRLLQRIGAGGYGAVYRALQPNVDREVAIKVILPEYANRPVFIRRFEAEAQVVARLEHPHIVPLYDYWREPNSAYLVMRYLRGGSLRDAIDEGGPWEIRAAAQMVNQISAALAFAHQNNVIHRDLKSDNILLDEAGNGYLGDFGIAKDLDVQHSLTKDSILGTPAYLAPEQIRGEIASAQTDIYALGILTYELLTGTKPFIDVTPATIMYRQLNEPLPDVTDLMPELPQDLNLVLQRATAKDKTLRYDTALDYAREFQEVVRSVITGTPSRGLTSSPGSITREELALMKPPNPYKGLRAFQLADSVDFFGRDELVERLLGRLRGEENAFLAVVGPSGSGKSSVVKAGLLPRIQAGVLDDAYDWYTVEMVPGTHPIEELEAALLAVATVDMPGLFEQLTQNDRGLVRAIKRLLPSDRSQLVLVIDQFEELFTLVDEEALRVHFLNLIMSACADSRSRIKIIATLRADFYDRPLYYTAFGQLLRERTEVVLPLTPEELEAAVRGPAERVGVAIDPGLVSAVVSDVSQQPGALPLLQYALTELYERTVGPTLALETYAAIGGTSGALAKRAEEIYDEFAEREQAIARQVFLRLVALGEGTEDTRRRVLRIELLSLSTDKDGIETVLSAYGRSRLLTFDRDPQTRSATVEVAHEALIRQWERLRGWLDENREGLRLQRRLTVSSQEWIQSGKERSFLARGVRLQQLEDLASSGGIALNDLESEYLQASISAREEMLAIERARLEREEALEARARNRLRALAAVLAIAAVIAFGLAAFGLTQSEIAESARVEAVNNEAAAATSAAEARFQSELAATAQSQAEANAGDAEAARLVAEANEAAAARSAAEARSLALAANSRNALVEYDPRLALALALEAVGVYEPPSTQVRQVLANVAYAPGPTHRLQGHTESVVTVAYKPDGRFVASGDVGGVLVVWDSTTGQAVTEINTEGIAILDVALHPTSDLVFAALADGTVRGWSIADGEEVQRFDAHTGLATTIDLSDDGRFLLSGGEDTQIVMWGLASGIELRRFTGHIGVIMDLAFSADGTRFVSSAGDEMLADTNLDAEDRTMRLWDVDTERVVYTINPDSGLPRTLDYSPDGTMLAVGVWDDVNGGTVRVYDVEDGDELIRFFGHPNIITAVRFSPDSQLIASAAWDNTIRVRDIARGVDVLRFDAFDDRPLDFAYAPDGGSMVIGIGNIGNQPFSLQGTPIDTSVWLWNTRFSDEILSFNAHQDWVWAVALHPNGQLAATGSGPLRLPQAEQGEMVVMPDTSVRLWDVETGEELRRFTTHSNTVDSVAFHPDGASLFSAGWDGLIFRWDIETGERLGLYRAHQGRVHDINLNSDGTRLLSAGSDTNGDDDRNDNLVYLWDVPGRQIIQTYTGHTGGVNSAVFSPDERTIATASADRTIRLWDVETGEELRQINGHTGSVNEVIFSPDGRWLASSSWDDTVRLWDVETGQQLRAFVGHNGNTFGLAFTADASLLLTTSEDGTIRLWNVETGEEYHRFTTHTDWIQEVVLSPDEQFALSAAQDRTAKVWRIDRDVADLQRFVQDNRYVRDLTCAELELYGLGLAPGCAP